jgi:hypothetical protein
MTVYRLPPKPVVASALASGVSVSSRLHDVAANAGYVVGPGGIQVFSDGSVDIDADRDLTADWLAWDPTVPTQAEQADAQLREAIRQARAGLQQIVTIAEGPNNLAQAQIKTGFGRLAGTLDDLIGLLDRRGLIGGS